MDIYDIDLPSKELEMQELRAEIARLRAEVEHWKRILGKGTVDLYPFQQADE